MVEDGVLTLTLPKIEEHKLKTITVKAKKETTQEKPMKSLLSQQASFCNFHLVGYDL